MVRIWIRMLRIPFEWFEFTFECFESLRMVRIWIRMLRILSNGSNSFRMVRIWIRMLRIGMRMLSMPFEWLEFAFDFFEPRLKDSNLHSNAQNLVQMVRLLIRMFRIPFKWFEFTFECFEFGFECFESLSNGQNLHSNASNPFRIVRIWICKLAFECFNSCGCNLLYVVDNVGSLDTAHSKQQTTCVY